MPSSRDIVIIGGGHNGLVTAFYLAKAGFKPLVLERRNQVGGAAITEEFHPGFRSSVLAHSAALRPDVVRDMQLEKHGLKLITRKLRSVHSLQTGVRWWSIVTLKEHRKRSPSFRRKTRPRGRHSKMHCERPAASFPSCSR